MLTDTAIEYFGNMARIARALKVSRTAVWKWHHRNRGRIPAEYASQLHVITKGRLKFDVAYYGRPHEKASHKSS